MSRAKTADLLALLRAKVLGPEGQGSRAVFLDEVPDGTGWKGKRRADGMSFGMWPSRGCLVEGYELKVSKGDWKSELKDPSKAEAIARFCDHWWLVTLPGIVDVGELPVPWGLMTQAKNGRGLSIEKQPVPLDPDPIDRVFLASLLRNAVTADVRHEAKLKKQEVEEVVRHRIEKPLKDAERERDNFRIQREDVQELQREFEDAIGMSIRRFLKHGKHDLEVVGEVAKAMLSGDYRPLQKRIDDQVRDLDQVRSQLAKASTLLASEQGGAPTD